MVIVTDQNSKLTLAFPMGNHIDSSCDYIPRQFDTPVFYSKLCIDRQRPNVFSQAPTDVIPFLKSAGAGDHLLSFANNRSSQRYNHTLIIQ